MIGVINIVREQFNVNSMLKGLHGKLGDEDYIEPLEILINSLNKHNKFNRFGKIAFNHQLKNRLKMRKMLNELHFNNNFDEPAALVLVSGIRCIISQYIGDLCATSKDKRLKSNDVPDLGKPITKIGSAGSSKLLFK